MQKRTIQPQKFRLVAQRKQNRQIHQTPQFLAIQKENPTIALQTYKFVLKNMKKIGLAPITDPKTGIKIENTYTGAYAGGEGVTFKVTHKKQVFYLKLIRKYLGQNSPRAYQTIEKVLTRIKNKVGRYKVKLIRPHLVYTPKRVDVFMAILTDFYSKNQVIHLAEEGINKKRYEINFKPECDTISRIMEKNGVVDVERHNMFFEKKTGTILLFDPS